MKSHEVKAGAVLTQRPDGTVDQRSQFKTVSDARWTGEVRLIAEHLADPLRWKKPRRIFVNSMSDLFHEKLTNEQIAAVFGVMAAAPQHTFQVLTKRAKRMREWFAWVSDHGYSPIGTEAIAMLDTAHQHAAFDAFVDVPHPQWPLPNVWLGVSVENQDAADGRIPELLATPAAVRFLSCEPLLGAITLPVVHVFGGHPAPRHIDWIIAGCESGPGARVCDVAWLRSLRDQCAAASVPFFLKQAVDGPGITQQAGSKRKSGSVIELPYLDGVQHAEFPR